MATAGPTLPASGTDNSGVGTTTWTNPGNATGDDNAYATVLGTSGAQSHYLWCANYSGGLSGLDDGDTVDGITVTIGRKADQNGALRYVNDAVVSLIVAGALSGDNKAATSTKWPTTEADASYGGAADKWGLTSPTGATVKATNFGVALSVKCFGSSGATASVDYIKLTVDYTSAAGGGQPMQLRGVWVPGLRQWQPGRVMLTALRRLMPRHPIRVRRSRQEHAVLIPRPRFFVSVMPFAPDGRRWQTRREGAI